MKDILPIALLGFGAYYLFKHGFFDSLGSSGSTPSVAASGSPSGAVVVPPGSPVVQSAAQAAATNAIAPPATTSTSNPLATSQYDPSQIPGSGYMHPTETNNALTPVTQIPVSTAYGSSYSDLPTASAPALALAQQGIQQYAQQAQSFLAQQPTSTYQYTRAAIDATAPPTEAGSSGFLLPPQQPIQFDVRDFLQVDPSGMSIQAIPGVAPPPISANVPTLNVYTNPATQSTAVGTWAFQAQISSGSVPPGVPESATFKQWKMPLYPIYPPGGYTGPPTTWTTKNIYDAMKAFALSWWNKPELTKADWDWVMYKVASVLPPPDLWNTADTGPQTLDTYWQSTGPGLRTYGLSGLMGLGGWAT